MTTALRLVCVLFLLFQGTLQMGSPPVTGKILDRGQAVSGARVIYTNPSTGRRFSTVTDAKGEFVFAAVPTGVYVVEVFDAKGTRRYHGKRAVALSPGLEDLLKKQEVTLSPVATDNVLELDLAKVHTDQDPELAAMNTLIEDLNAAMAAHDWPQARDKLQQLIVLRPEQWEFYQDLGEIDIFLARYDDAVRTLEKGIDILRRGGLAPDLTREKTSLMLMSVGEAYKDLDQLEKAVSAYEEAADRASHPAMALFLACDAAQHIDAAQAIGLCQRAITADPAHWEFYATLARIQAQSDSAAAIAAYDRGVEVARTQLASGPGSDLAKAGIGQMRAAQGNLYAKQKQYEQAIAAFREATDYAAYPFLPWSNLCITYFNMQRMPETVAACDKTISLDPDYEDAYYIKASALLASAPRVKGKTVAPAGAREALQKYLQLAPGGTYAASAKSKLQQIAAP